MHPPFQLPSSKGDVIRELGVILFNDGLQDFRLRIRICPAHDAEIRLIDAAERFMLLALNGQLDDRQAHHCQIASGSCGKT
jgi:hypothetical protein